MQIFYSAHRAWITCLRQTACVQHDTAGSREARGYVLTMESVEESFSTFLSERFPPNAKRSTSGPVFWEDFGRRVIQVLRDPAAGDKNLRFFI